MNADAAIDVGGAALIDAGMSRGPQPDIDASLLDAMTFIDDAADMAGHVVDSAADMAGELVDQGVSDSNGPDVAFEVLYPAERIHSPIDRTVLDSLHSLIGAADNLRDDVFMKVGASSTVSRRSFYCFDGGGIDLGDYEHLRETLDYFQDGMAGNTSPFSRETLAARVGRGAGWAIDGEPSPLQAEIDVIQPRFAFVHYGTNDMGFGATYGAALRVFYDNMSDLLDVLERQGIVPILIGISARLDNPSADLWVPTFNTVIRGLAQMRQRPFIDLHHALLLLDEQGISSDGLHLNSFRDGACQLTDDGLEYGYNVRNLITLQSLDRLRAALSDELLEVPGERLFGRGTHDEPYQIESFPFVHHADTALSAERRFDRYGCDDADESGAEIVYTFELARPSRVRGFVFDRGDVDIDIHLLGADGGADNCMDRDHHAIDVELEPGIYRVVLDTFVSASGRERAGEFLVALTACALDAPDCRWD